ncbi:MAG TPA: GntR family transcriptional regulator [Herpetosiphonaceae bacterium]|nr:GntR family transcriptional regulator [Herpetosiphonaceae bacterium]
MTLVNKMAVLNKQGAVPLYVQLKKLIEGQITDGALAAHSRVPSERELSEQFGISRMTARQALAELIQEGRLYTSVGKGTFVAEPKIHQNLQSLTSFTEDMLARGLVPTTRIIRREFVLASATVASGLHIAEGSNVVCVERLRLADDKPLALETACLAFEGAERLLTLDLDGSLYAVLQAEFGLIPTEALEELDAVLAQPRERLLLNLSEGAPVLKILRTTFDGQGHAFEYVESVYRGDRYRFVARLIRDDGL